MLDINVKTIDGQNRSYSVPDNVIFRFLFFWLKCMPAAGAISCNAHVGITTPAMPAPRQSMMRAKCIWTAGPGSPGPSAGPPAWSTSHAAKVCKSLQEAAPPPTLASSDTRFRAVCNNIHWGLVAALQHRSRQHTALW